MSKRADISAAGGHALAWLAFGLIHVAVVSARGAIPDEQALALIYLGQVLGQAVILAGAGAGALAALDRVSVPALARWIALAALSVGVAIWATRTELDNLWPLARVAIGAALGLAVPAAVWCGERARARTWTRAFVWVLAPLAIVGVYGVRPGEYPAGHAVVLTGLVCLMAAALVETPLPDRLAPRTRAAWVAGAVSLVLACAGLLVPTGSTVRLYHSRDPGSVLPELRARLARLDTTRATISDAEIIAYGLDPSWFGPRDDAPPRLPTRAVVVDNPIVLLITIDALRHELVDPEFHRRFPELGRHWRAGTRFDQAYSTASSTIPAFASIMTGKFYSELRWAKKKLSSKRKKYFLTEDTSVRFPELLTAAGVRTVHVPITTGLVADYGVLTGFEIETEKHLSTRLQVKELLAQIDAGGDRPMFLTAHLLEAHAPYNRRLETGTPYERYLSEVEIIDEQLVELRKGLAERGLSERTVWLITADHGEAFGEHDNEGHAGGIYEELIKVPLVVEVPGQAPGVVEEPVSLMDIGPTILDLFGIATPGVWTGTSLLPSVADPDAALALRPIGVEAGRRMQCLLFPDGYKVMVDVHRHTEEIYQLEDDPGERNNLVDVLPDAAVRLELVTHFFASREFQARRYETPYRP